MSNFTKEKDKYEGEKIQHPFWTLNSIIWTLKMSQNFQLTKIEEVI